MATYEIRLLGPPSLTRNGQEVRLRSTKTLGLLTYLILEPSTVHSREKLASLLWGETTESRARNSLRQALYSVRKNLGEAILYVDNTTAAFQPSDDVWVDAGELRATLSNRGQRRGLDDLQRAADLYRGMLLEGITPTGCPAFDEWLFFEREDMEQLVVVSLRQLTAGLLTEGRLADAELYVHRLLALDPLHEHAHRTLMRIHGVRRDLDSVRRCYEQLTDLLARELGVEPARETQDLYEDLNTRPLESLTPRSHVDVSRPESGAPTLPFVGRRRELAVLNQHFDQAMRGQGQLIIISGEAGAGKTRLVSELLQTQGAHPGRTLAVLKGTCYAPESRSPYGMWADALSYLAAPATQDSLSGLAEVWRRQITRLVPTLGPVAEEMPGTTPEENRLRLMQAVVQTLYTVSTGRRLCLWFEDLHWADQASLELLHYAERHLRSASVFIVGTYRTEALVDNPDLEQFLTRATSVTVLEAKPLDREAVGEALPSVGIPPTEQIVERLHQHSGGNALFLIETVRELLEGNGVSVEETAVLREEDAALPVPERMRELLRARLVDLDDTQHRVLAAAAVIGRPCGLRLLRRISGLTEFEALDAVDGCLRRALFVELPRHGTRPGLAFRHDYYREVLYDDLSGVQRRAFHRRIASALLALPRQPQAITEEVAIHYARAGDPRAVALLTRAAEHAEELYATRHATELYTRALDLLDMYGPDAPEQRFDLLRQREALLDRQGARHEQDGDLVAMAELAEQLGDTDRQAYVKVRRAGYLTTVGRYAEARQIGDAALTSYRESGDSQGEAQALRELGFLHWSAGDYSTALSYGRTALELHRRAASVEGEATALHNLAEIHRTLGSPQQALAQYEAALQLHWATQNQQRQGHSLYGMGHARRQLGQNDRALHAYEQALACFHAAKDPLMQSRVHHTLAWLAWEADALDQAREHAQRALEISQEIGFGLGIAHGHVALGEIAAAQGDREAGCTHLTKAIGWLRLMEAKERWVETERRLQALEQGLPDVGPALPAMDWVKSHVTLPEGKVYCAFESPMAQAGAVPPILVDLTET